MMNLETTCQIVGMKKHITLRMAHPAAALMRLAFFFLSVATWLVLLAQTSHAQVAVPTTAGDPFFCDARFYQIRADTTTGNPTSGRTYLVRYPSLSAGATPDNPYGNNYIGGGLNALGYNPRDSYLYALSFGTATDNQLYRIGQNGVELVGTIAGLPAGFITTGGVFDKQGRYYFAGQGGGNISPSIIYRVDNIPASGSAALTIARSYALNTTLTNVGDFAFADASDGINGILYGGTNTLWSRVTLNDAAASATVATTTVAPTVGGIGSTFYDRPTNQMYVFNNGASTFFQVTGFAGPGAATSAASTVNAPAFIPAGFTNSATDGASCIFASVQQADMAVVKTAVPTGAVTAGQTVTFTVVLSNLGTNPAGTTTVTDTLPAGLSFVSAAATNGSYSNVTGLWTLTSMPSNSTQTLTIVTTVNTAGTSTASFANVATTGQGRAAGTTTVVLMPDPNLTNNTSAATPTVVVSANLQISKTNNVTALVAGSTTSYTLTVANISGFTVANSVLRDPATPGLSCTLAPSCTVVTAPATCPVVGGGAGQLSAANLQSVGGVQIPSIGAGGRIAIVQTCGVTATGQ
jgi:uncharacterized repeat protein (TIGR01451 family)